MQRTQNPFHLGLAVRLQSDWKVKCKRLWCAMSIKPWQYEASVQLAATSTAALMESQLAINPEQAQELPLMLGKKFMRGEQQCHPSLRNPLPPWFRISNKKFLNYVLIWIFTDFCKPEWGVLSHYRMVSMLDSIQPEKIGRILQSQRSSKPQAPACTPEQGISRVQA